MSRHVLTIDGWMPTALNRLMRMDRHGRSKALYEDAQVIGAEARSQGIPRAACRRRVSLVLRYPNGKGAVDPDAFFKSTLDALCKCGLLRQDDRHWLELGPVTYEVGVRRGIAIVLEDMDEGGPG